MRPSRTLPRSVLLLALAFAAGCAERAPEAPVVTRLTPEGGDQWEGVRSPDGSRMAWLSRGAEEVELWVSDATDESRKLADMGGGAEVPPRWSPDGRYLLYASRHNTDNFDVWVADLTADTAAAIVSTSAVEMPIAWHPTAARFIYSSSRGGRWGCRVRDLATGEDRQLVPDLPEACGRWSPDGSRLAYQDLQNAGTRGSILMVADADGRGGRPLTAEGMEFLAFSGTHGPWSPDGTQLLYESRRTGRADLWVVDAGGGAPRQLTKDIRDDSQGAWSPDGRQVAFVSDRGGQTDLWVVPAAGGKPMRLTNTPEAEYAPQWTPDGGRVLFTAARSVSRLWRMALASGEATPFSPEDQIASAPELSPDGRQVAYEVERSGGMIDIFLLPATGGTPRALAARAGENEFIRFAPDGSRITFHSDRKGSLDVWTVDTAGTGASQVTSDSATERTAQWSADGGTLYYWRSRGGGLGDIWGLPTLGGQARQVSRLGSVFMFWVNPVRPEVYAGAVNDAGRAILVAVDPATGASRVLFDAAPLADLPRYAFSDDGRYAAIGAVNSTGGIATHILDVETGATKPVGAGRSIPDGLSPDGKYMMLRTWRPGQYNPDLQLIDVEQGTSRWLTETPEWEGSTRWLPGGEDIVFVRRDYREHLAEVAVPAAGTSP